MHLFGDNAAAAMQFHVKAGIGRRYQQRILKCFVYLISKKRPVTIYVHWVWGSYKPVEPLSRSWSDFDGERELSMVASREHFDALWERTHLCTVFLWTLEVPMGPFAVPQTWRAKLWSPDNPLGLNFHPKGRQRKAKTHPSPSATRNAPKNSLGSWSDQKQLLRSMWHINSPKSSTLSPTASSKAYTSQTSLYTRDWAVAGGRKPPDPSTAAIASRAKTSTVGSVKLFGFL